MYINDIIHVINEASTSQLSLYRHDFINILLYADDLVILAKSQDELQTKMDKLTELLNEKKLHINESKTKCMVFNRGNKLCKVKLFINGSEIESVKSFKYLGFTVGAKNCSFSGTCNDLSIKTKRAIFALNSKIRLNQIPVKLALKLFTALLEPILLYGAEVWGPYVFTDLHKWERSESEKVHTQYLKRILGCDLHASNLMVRTELGRTPLICNIIRKSVLYIQNVKSRPDSLVCQALEFEGNNTDNCNIFQLVRKFTPFYQEHPETHESKEP